MNAAILEHATGYALLAMPALLLVSAMPSARPGAACARKYRQRVQWASLLAFVLAIVASISYILGARGDLMLGPLPWASEPRLLTLSIQVNGLTLVLASLVSFVVVIITRYSLQYLNGDRDQARFFRLMAVTGGFFLSVVIAGNLGQFTLGIIATGFGLHRLLMFYADRPRAIMATHKKAIFSRMADACLVGATMLVGHQVGSLEFSQINAYAASHAHLPIELQLAAWLIAFAAILKSAQFPFHGWLLQVMEAPTPVSALMHAGVVYSGAIIVLRTNGLLSAEGSALALIAIVGLATLMIASLVMLTQSAIKSSLAWSTTAQLGFMLLELGLGLFALALLHLVGHSLYKAHAFLSSGSMADHLRQARVLKSRRITLPAWLITVAGSLLVAFGLANVMGLTLDREPTLLAVLTIIALATAQLVLKALTHGNAREVAGAAVIATGMAAIYFILHALFMKLFVAEFEAVPSSITRLEEGLITLVALGFMFMAWLQGPGRELMSRNRQRAWFIHLYNGLYVDLWVERLAYRLWPEKVGRRDFVPDGEQARNAAGAEM